MGHLTYASPLSAYPYITAARFPACNPTIYTTGRSSMHIDGVMDAANGPGARTGTSIVVRSVDNVKHKGQQHTPVGLEARHGGEIRVGECGDELALAERRRVRDGELYRDLEHQARQRAEEGESRL